MAVDTFLDQTQKTLIDMNYFVLFNLTPSFVIDTTALVATYQQLQKLTHPDKFATASDRDKLIALQKNSQVNDGYQVLKKPLSRAEHILELRGVELQHEQKTMQDGAFLMQQMEWREQLEDAQHTDEPLAALEELDDEVAQDIKTLLSELGSLLEETDDAANESAANRVRKLKFLYKLRHEIELKEDALSDF